MKYLFIGIILLIGCSPGNLDYVKKNAEQTFESNNFNIIGYHGYRWGIWGFNNYGGSRLWYTIEKIPSNGIIYQATLSRWGDEIHIYNIEAIDAIKP